MNSREKGKRGERQWRDELRANGYAARRGQQFSGSADSPDVVCDQLRWIHFEVKAVERLNIEDAMAQARRDCGSGRETPHPSSLPKGAREKKIPIVAHKRNFCRWLVTMEAETFFKLLSGELPPPPVPPEKRDEQMEFKPILADANAEAINQDQQETKTEREKPNEDQSQ